MKNSSNAELLSVIADFLEMGHVENIMAMFKQDTSLYDLAGRLLKDERYMVRMGTVVLFEEMARIRPEETKLAVPSLLPLLKNETPWIRGETVTLLGIIGSPEALNALDTMRDDPDPQVRELVSDILN